MSLKLTRKDQLLFAGAGLVFILLIAVALVFSSGEAAKAEHPSTYSAASRGAKAAYLLLSDAGYKMQRWERPLSDLPAAEKKTLILAEPEEAPTSEER